MFDDYTRYCWVFFMKIKFEVFQNFYRLYKITKNIFKFNIKQYTLRQRKFDKNSNNGLQYFVKRMVMFINLQYLIIHNKMDDPNVPRNINI